MVPRPASLRACGLRLSALISPVNDDHSYITLFSPTLLCRPHVSQGFWKLLEWQCVQVSFGNRWSWQWWGLAGVTDRARLPARVCKQGGVCRGPGTGRCLVPGVPVSSFPRVVLGEPASARSSPQAGSL